MSHSSLLSSLRIADLELFITASRHRSLGKAASLHHLSQSAASSAIQRVESAFGKPLCLHEKRQFRLTSEGIALLPRAEEWLKQLRESVASEISLPLRIATTHAIARVAIAPILSLDAITLSLMRPDLSYAAVLRDEADVALVLDNAPWEDIVATEVGKGYFQLFSKIPTIKMTHVLLPEDQLEVLALQQRFQKLHGKPLEIKARLPSWSLIADICASSSEVGFLPDFLAKEFHLHPVDWQPEPSHYRILALSRKREKSFQARLKPILSCWSAQFMASGLKQSYRADNCK